MDNDSEVLVTFIGHTSRTFMLLEDIMAHVENHLGVAPEEINWGHVGTLSKVYSDLEEIAKFLGVEPT